MIWVRLLIFLRVLPGNKSDLEDQRQVEESAGREFAKEISGIFSETSAKDTTGGINDLFTKIGHWVPRSSCVHSVQPPQFCTLQTDQPTSYVVCSHAVLSSSSSSQYQLLSVGFSALRLLACWKCWDIYLPTGENLPVLPAPDAQPSVVNVGGRNDQPVSGGSTKKGCNCWLLDHKYSTNACDYCRCGKKTRPENYQHKD